MIRDEAITWGELYRDASISLASVQEARWLCEHASGLSANEFDAAGSELVSERSGIAFRELVRRRVAGEPLQYVMQRWAFRSLDVLVDPRVLIPRPETELVTQIALDLAREVLETCQLPIRIADLGTGSGVIGLALASEMPRSGVEVWLTDISSDALNVARANLAGLGLVGGDVRIACGSWFAALPGELQHSFDIVVSNPPYIALDDASVEPTVRNWEPHLALYSGTDGLDAHRTIISQAQNWLVNSGWLVLEIGHEQGSAIRGLLLQNNFADIEIRQDYSHHDRIALARKL